MRAALALLLMIALAGCEDYKPTSNSVQTQQQEKILVEATSQVGMPAIKNFRERKLLKDIYELRDQTGLTTYTYLWNAFAGRLVFLCNSIGYGIPYATQFTASSAMQRWSVPGGDGCARAYGHQQLPQADPNGLFSPASAEGTWVLCKDPTGKDTRPVYIEPRVVVSPFRLAP